MKIQVDVKTLLVIAVILSAAQLRAAAETNAIDLKQLVQQYLPGAKFLPSAPAKPRAVIAASGDALDLNTALRENPEPRKGAGYWLTPTMRYLGRQHIAMANSNDATGLVKLLLTMTRGAAFVRQNTLRAKAVDGGWVVEVEHDFTKFPEKVPATPPYELLVESGHVAQMRERCYAFSGSPVVYDHTIRTVYEREFKLNGGINYQAVVEKELANESTPEKTQKLIK